jgi:hypothetical protein
MTLGVAQVELPHRVRIDHRSPHLRGRIGAFQGSPERGHQIDDIADGTCMSRSKGVEAQGNNK